MEYTKIVDEFVQDDKLLELCDTANRIYDALRSKYPEFCTPTLVWACMLRAGREL